MPLLYHVTRTANSKLIEKEGFYPGSPFAEGGLAAEIAEAELAGEEIGEYGEQREDEVAREQFNEFMDEARREYPDKPSHSNGVFFWSDIRDADYAKTQLEYIFGPGSAKIDIIDTDYVNCKFWSGNFTLSDKLFDLILRDPIEATNCLEGVSEGQCEDFDDIARQYYKDMDEWDGMPESGREIITSCHIPPSAIVKVVDPGGKEVEVPMNDPLDKQIAIAIPTETYYRDAYREMANEAEHEGDELSANTLKYISGDEEEHHELLMSVQCRRTPEKCEYGPQFEHMKGDHVMDDKRTIADVMNQYSDPPAGLSSPPAGLGESVAAEHFGRAICLGPGDEYKQLSELNPEQRKCVQDVGMGWENAIVSKFETRIPATSITEDASLIGNTGEKIGSLKLNNGVVTLCFNTGSKEYPTPKCGQIGAGFDSFVAAQQILGLMGVAVRPMG